jgi:F0F1-type ATP synthase epsilon subunit
MLTCTITSTEKTEQYAGVRQVRLPAYKGEMQVLPGHAEMFVILRNGDLVLRQSDGREESKRITGGECHIRDDHVTVVI